MAPGHLTKLSLIYVKLQVSYIRDRHEAVTNWSVMILVAIFQVNALHDFMRVTRESGNNNTT